MPLRLRLRPLPGPGQSLLAARSAWSRAAAQRPAACFVCSSSLRRSSSGSNNLLVAGACRIPVRYASTAAAAANSAASSASSASSASAASTAAESAAAAATTSETAALTPQQIRADLADALHALEQHAGALVNLPRLQLAIRGLQQPAGEESIRVAMLGLAGADGPSSGSGRVAQALLRLVLADPLQDAQPWEAQLTAHDPAEPLIVRVRPAGNDAGKSATIPGRLQRDATGLAIIDVPSPVFGASQLEFLVMESTLAVPQPPASAAAGVLEGPRETFEETVLVPAVQVPSGRDGPDGHHLTPIATPVHQALIVADGILGAAAVAGLPLGAEPDTIHAAVRLSLSQPETAGTNDAAEAQPLPFTTFDTAISDKALTLFRDSVANARAYETLWLRGGVSGAAVWLREGALHRADDTTKPPVRRLVASVLRHATANIETAEAKLAGKLTGASTHPQAPPVAETFAALDTALADWAEEAHAELQQQLDLAFAGAPWRKLGWWKLFWRADDVTMLSSGLVTRRFLPTAEQRVVYLAGRVHEAMLLLTGPPPAGSRTDGIHELYAAPAMAGIEDVDGANVTNAATNSRDNIPPRTRTRWPTHIAFTRRYLLDETVPALQALAQKLVLETLGASGLAAALATLTYLSAVGASEAGAVAALGLVWSLGRLQSRWEAARKFWEAEVREEGRKAVRAAEASVAIVLDEARDAAAAGGHSAEDRRRLRHDLRDARTLVDAAEAALARLR